MVSGKAKVVAAPMLWDPGVIKLQKALYPIFLVGFHAISPVDLCLRRVVKLGEGLFPFLGYDKMLDLLGIAAKNGQQHCLVFLKTLLNGWCTTERMHEDERLPFRVYYCYALS